MVGLDGYFGQILVKTQNVGDLFEVVSRCMGVVIKKKDYVFVCDYPLEGCTPTEVNFGSTSTCGSHGFFVW